jgi:hypothetical protein
MAMLVGIASSKLKGEQPAIEEAYTKASADLQGQQPTFMMLFASPTAYNQQELLKALHAKCPNAPLIGCSTSGEITSLAGSIDQSISLLLIYSDQMRFVPGIGNDIKTDPRQAGKALAQNIQANGNGEMPRASIILPDGLAGNGADVVRGILDIFGQEFMVVGGSAGDDYQFKQTYEYYGEQVLSGSVVGVGLYGNFSFGIGVRHGWIPIGSSKIATKSEGNILYELDGKPAISIYEEYFGKDQPLIDKKEPFAKLAVTYPLGIPTPNKDGYLVRDPITVDDNGAINCAAEIPQGSEVFIMIGSRDEAIDAAADAAKRAVAMMNGKTVKVAIIFNCIARKKLFMMKKQEEIDTIQSVLGKEVPLIGFYTYGEQAPLGGEVITCSFHNETDVIFLLGE